MTDLGDELRLKYIEKERKTLLDDIEIEQAHYRRAEKRQRSKDDVQQSRLIPEDPAIDIGV